MTAKRANVIPEAEAELRAAGERVIAAFTSGTLRDNQRRALIALGDALRAAQPDARPEQPPPDSLGGQPPSEP